MQEIGQQFSIWTIRLAVLLWIGFAVLWIRRDRISNARMKRMWAWGLATLLLVIHVISAFAYFHDWSHQLAAEHTAKVTDQVVGWYWSGGIWFNYLFVLLCGVEAYLWTGRRHPLLRSKSANRLVYGITVFMMINAAIVFAFTGFRWVALAGLGLVCVEMFRQRRSEKAAIDES